MLGILRDATEHMSTPNIARAIMRLAGHEDSAFLTILAHVRSGLGDVMRGGKVQKIGTGRSARWRLA